MIFSTPEFPAKYPDNICFDWLIDVNFSINLFFHSFYTEKGSDFVSVNLYSNLNLLLGLIEKSDFFEIKFYVLWH